MSQVKSYVGKVLRKAVARIDPTVSEHWEMYARRHVQKRPGSALGDEWNEAGRIGIDVSDKEIPQYLDEKLFAPFLGECETILEIGPGGGRFTEILLPKCKKLIAVDTSKTMIKLLRERFGENRGIQYVHAGPTAGLEGIGDATVDAVFSYDVFVHLPQWDTFNYLQHISRVLRPGGKAIIHHADTFSDLGWARFLDDSTVSLGRHKPGWTFSVMTPELMTDFLGRAGLEPVSFEREAVARDCITLIRKPEAG